MQIFASLLRSCAFLALTTGSLGQTVPASALEELRVEFREMNEVLRNENALKFEEVKNENTALRLELGDIRNLLQTRPRRTFENDIVDCMRQDEVSGDVIFDGCNVHIWSGEGSTEAEPNGKGNLIIGYNEVGGDPNPNPSRVGSHNLIIGYGHEYTSYGGIVTGWSNSISNFYSAVVGGYSNLATGVNSAVTGGAYNEASGVGSSISGGISNSATDKFSTVTGGTYNEASGEASSISGGSWNTASGDFSSVSGGQNNEASGWYSSVLGGHQNKAEGEEAVVTGGMKNRANKLLAVVVGGKRNKAEGKLSVVTGA